jgi:hypothetical protein
LVEFYLNSKLKTFSQKQNQKSIFNSNSNRITI